VVVLVDVHFYLIRFDLRFTSWLPLLRNSVVFNFCFQPDKVLTLLQHFLQSRLFPYIKDLLSCFIFLRCFICKNCRLERLSIFFNRYFAALRGLAETLLIRLNPDGSLRSASNITNLSRDFVLAKHIATC